MRKRYLTLLILVSNLTFADYIFCEQAFVMHFKRTHTKNFVAYSKKYSDFLHEKQSLAKTPQEKYYLLESEYSLLSNVYEIKRAKILKRAGGGNLPLAQRRILEKRIHDKIVDEFAPISNRITTAIGENLNFNNFPVVIKTRKSASGVEIKYLEFDITKAVTADSSQAQKKVQHYIRRFGTKHITFDFFQNIEIGSAGFSQANIRRIDLGIRGARNIALDDLITMVGKHEFKHAAFGAYRRNGIESIYHTSFMARGADTLSKRSQIYTSYMSAEELYNFANNPYWASSRIKNIKNYAEADYLNDIFGINNYIKMSNQIADQTEDITDEFIKLLRRAKSEKSGNFFNIDFLDVNQSGIKQAADTEYILFQNIKSGHDMLFHLGDKYSKEVQTIMTNFQSINAGYATEMSVLLKNNDTAGIQKLSRLIELETFKKTGPELDRIFDKMLRDQETLNKVARGFGKENRVIEKETEDFIEELSQAKKKEINLSKDPYWQQKFLDLTHRYRELGNNVKENFKGFLGR